MDAGFFFLFKDYTGDTPSSFATVGDTAMMLFGMTLGEYEVFTDNTYTFLLSHSTSGSFENLYKINVLLLTRIFARNFWAAS